MGLFHIAYKFFVTADKFSIFCCRFPIDKALGDCYIYYSYVITYIK